MAPSSPGDTTATASAISPSPNSGFIAIAAGGWHSLDLKQDGSIIAWGYNGEGECNIPSPNTGFVAISAGWYHSLGLKQDGSIVAWGTSDGGYYDHGQVTDTPDGNNFVAIAAGFYHSLVYHDILICGYRRFSLMRASWVVNCQSTGFYIALRR